jgi:hypothetical protein
LILTSRYPIWRRWRRSWPMSYGGSLGGRVAYRAAQARSRGRRCPCSARRNPRALPRSSRHFTKVIFELGNGFEIPRIASPCPEQRQNVVRARLGLVVGERGVDVGGRPRSGDAAGPQGRAIGRRA